MERRKAVAVHYVVYGRLTTVTLDAAMDWRIDALTRDFASRTSTKEELIERIKESRSCRAPPVEDVLSAGNA